jgi:hypothetical protein
MTKPSDTKPLAIAMVNMNCSHLGRKKPAPKQPSKTTNAVNKRLPMA